ncbi:MAG: outer membrane protein transport protein [Pirellulales bacterium]|nr:outer membrane protein transport protein [Pirellulales bacterium]
MRFVITATIGFSLLFFLLPAKQARAQAFGIELHNTVMPASGAMGGASIARPQDLQSAIFGNPATLTQYQGTQFSFGGAWIEPTFNMDHAGGALPGVDAYSGKSNAQGSALGNIGVTQDLSALGRPITLGIGLFSGAGAGVSFRDIPESNGTSNLIQVLQITAAGGVEMTDRLSLGGSIILGAGTLDGPFVGLTAGAYDYALRGKVGLSYEVGCATTIGMYYETRQKFRFDDAVRLQLTAPPNGTFSVAQDINVGLPDNIGLGIANCSLADGRLLLAMDVLYKQWKNADLFSTFYTNQWVFQFGTQYELNRKVRLRAGYVYAEDITEPNPGNSAGGVTPPGLTNGLQYVQATLPAINEHRISGGIGCRDVLPGVDIDISAGGMFPATQEYGSLTTIDLESYWLAFGITWRFGRGACERLPVPDHWCGGAYCE